MQQVPLFDAARGATCENGAMGVIRALVSVFSGQQPFEDVQREFERMLRLTVEMAALAGEIFWGEHADPAGGRRRLYEQDVEVNRTERRVRKLLAAHAVAGTTADATHALRFMSLVKDAERVGDYAKNIAELPELTSEPLPLDLDVVQDMRRIVREIEALSSATVDAMNRRDTDKAHALTASGRKTAKECDALVKRFAASNLSAGLAVRLAVGARFYKRIAAHQLNILSSLLMPLHKLDYFDDSDSRR
jgi:phosphate uptake regulator